MPGDAVVEYPTVRFTEPLGNSRERPQPNLGQQDKIVSVILRKDPKLIGYSSVQLQPGERGRYLNDVASGKIGDTDYDGLLSTIQTPLALEQNERNPVMLFQRISGDRQVRGIISHFVRGDLQTRGALVPQDIYTFARQLFPNALAFEKHVEPFLKGIEEGNGAQKRREYEDAVEKLGNSLYGKQWEYLKQVRLLEEDSAALVAVPAKIEVAARSDPRRGIEQLLQFNREHRLRGKVTDGYKDGGRYTRFDNEGKPLNPSREVIIVDRDRDVRLRQMIEQAKAIHAQYGTGLRTAFELSKLVYQKMDALRALQIVEREMDNKQGKEFLIGDINVENGLAGVCRHRSLLFQVLASEVGVDPELVRGNVSFGSFDAAGGHAWNELDLYGRKYVIDIMNPPGQGNFGKMDYATFMRQGGFPEMGINRKDYRYMDVWGQELFRV